MKGILLLLLTLACGLAWAKECTKAEAFAAERATDSLNTWDAIYSFFHKYRHCYDGAIAEGAEDKIQKLWVEKWATLPKMISYTKRDLEFKQFMWQRIGDETFPQDAFKVFVRHAKNECPRGAEEFCQAVLTEEQKLNEAQPGAPADAR